MEVLRIKVKKLLLESEVNLTITQICKYLNIDDEFDVMSVIGDLESTNEIEMKGMKKYYEPDGCAFYVAKYGCIDAITK